MIARKNWKKGSCNSLFKRETRQCINSECKEWFEVTPADPKKFCSYRCAAKVNNSKRNEVPPEGAKKLKELYQKGFSMQEISEKMGWKYGKVIYWMRKFDIPRRTMSDAIYAKCNPNGDPFRIKKKLNKSDNLLKGLGIGLYWGEGHKRSKWSIKVGNTDINLIKKFKEFLLEICGVNEKKIKYSLQVFNDSDSKEALEFWTRELKI
jgi:hypothetical protein